MLQTKSFGIDHPLIAVHDMALARSRFASIGFNMTPVGKHPWGTSTSLAIFNDCLLEVVSIYDASLIDVKPAGDFKFGRHVYQHLNEREGVALTALHSTDSSQDAHSAQTAGWSLSGHVEFGREVVLPDGNSDITKTSLALLPNSIFPRLSFFLCQQHRRDLVEVSEWMNHENGAYGINGITIKTSNDDHKALLLHLEAIFGQATPGPHGFTVQTPNGYIKILRDSEMSNVVGTLPKIVMDDKKPSIVAMEFLVRDIEITTQIVKASGLPYRLTKSGLLLDDASLLGNMLIQFHQK
jgi:hypothetical protein